MTYNILFAVVGIGLIAFGLSLIKLNGLVDSWILNELNLAKRINDVDNHRLEYSCRLDEVFKRIQDLENRIEGMGALVDTIEEKLNDSGGEE